MSAAGRPTVLWTFDLGPWKHLDHQFHGFTKTTDTVRRMQDSTREGVGRAPTLKRPRDTQESYPPSKRPKTNQDPTATPSESTVGYDACPMPTIMDYFYEDLIPKTPELSQLFPTLCHDVYVVRRWLGPAGCATFWQMIVEDISGPSSVSNSHNPLAGLIARSLAKLSGPHKAAPSSKFRTLCQTLESHLGPNDARGIVVFGELLWLGFLQKLIPSSASSRSCTSCRADVVGPRPWWFETNACSGMRGSVGKGKVYPTLTTNIS